MGDALDVVLPTPPKLDQYPRRDFCGLDLSRARISGTLRTTTGTNVALKEPGGSRLRPCRLLCPKVENEYHHRLRALGTLIGSTALDESVAEDEQAQFLTVDFDIKSNKHLPLLLKRYYLHTISKYNTINRYVVRRGDLDLAQPIHRKNFKKSSIEL